METIIIYIFAPLVSALLLWIGWLIRAQIKLHEGQRKQQEEYSLSMSKVSDCLDATVATLVAITDTLKVSLQGHDLEFKSLHDSGIINGESIKQRKKIAAEITRLDENKLRILKIIEEQESMINSAAPDEEDEHKERVE